MHWHYRIGRIFGIPIVIHVSFLIMLVVRAAWPLITGRGLRGALSDVFIVLSAFGFVFLHELGHAFEARQFGIRTRDIVFFPIGCAAEMHIPEEPREELRIAAAGPSVNFMFLLLLVPLAVAFGDKGIMGQALIAFAVINFVIMVFNLLPAFPLDGGRILRATLAMHFDRVRATWIAARIGQGFAVLLFVAGLKLGIALWFVAIFIAVLAQAEARITQMKADGLPVEEYETDADDKAFSLVE